MQNQIALCSHFLPSVHARNAQKRSVYIASKPRCSSLNQQDKVRLKTSWPLITLSLFGSGFFLGPLIDGLHSRVNLVNYQSGSVHIGPLHTNIWVRILYPLSALSLSLMNNEDGSSGSGSFSTGIVLCHHWNIATLLR